MGSGGGGGGGVGLSTDAREFSLSAEEDAPRGRRSSAVFSSPPTKKLCNFVRRSSGAVIKSGGSYLSFPAKSFPVF